MTTTPTIEGHKILEYKGLVSGEVILGANVLKDFMASISDVFGGRTSSYERVLQEGRESALREMEGRARGMGANAVVGISFDVGTMGPNGAMIMVIVAGTAVTI